MKWPNSPEQRSGLILACIAIVEGAWVVLNFVNNPGGFLRYAGLAPDKSGTALGWVLALLVTLLFVWSSSRLPSVRDNLFRPSLLKALAIAVAVAAGFLEEIVFRKFVMDYLQSEGFGPILQILASGIAFGVAHGVWGLLGRSARAAAGATIVTGILGAALGIVYVASGRSLAPCIAAHFLINVFIEPGLVLAATRGEMGSRIARSSLT